MEVFRDVRGRRDIYYLYSKVIRSCLKRKGATVYDIMRDTRIAGWQAREYAEKLVGYGLLKKVPPPPTARPDVKAFYVATRKGIKFIGLIEELRKVAKEPRRPRS